MTDLLLLAEAQIVEKQAKEIEKVKQRLEADKKLLKKAIELVNTHTLYKKVETSRGCYKYVLATEEMLKEDYLGKPAPYSCKGINFHYDYQESRYNKGIMMVNGHTYYDIRFALNEYEKMIEDKKREILRLNKTMADLDEDLRKLHENYPSLKQAVMEWMDYQKADGAGSEDEE